MYLNVFKFVFEYINILQQHICSTNLLHKCECTLPCNKKVSWFWNIFVAALFACLDFNTASAVGAEWYTEPMLGSRVLS